MPKKTPPTTELGEAIRHLREKILHLSQEELGAALNVKGNVISRWETGVNQPPVESLARLAHLAAKSDAEELRLYSEWVRMAGYPRPRLDGAQPSTPRRESEQSPSPRPLDVLLEVFVLRRQPLDLRHQQQDNGAESLIGNGRRIKVLQHAPIIAYLALCVPQSLPPHIERTPFL